MTDTRWLGAITDSMDMSFIKLQETARKSNQSILKVLGVLWKE